MAAAERVEVADDCCIAGSGNRVGGRPKRKYFHRESGRS